MSLGASLFLIAFGAILAYAVQPDAVSWIDIGVVGIILMVVGAIGLVLSLIQSAQASRR
jgi:preprotein translocase subunit Sss1